MALGSGEVDLEAGILKGSRGLAARELAREGSG